MFESITCEERLNRWRVRWLKLFSKFCRFAKKSEKSAKIFMCLFKKCRNGSQKRQQQKDNIITRKDILNFLSFFQRWILIMQVLQKSDLHLWINLFNSSYISRAGHTLRRYFNWEIKHLSSNSKVPTLDIEIKQSSSGLRASTNLTIIKYK